MDSQNAEVLPHNDFAIKKNILKPLQLNNNQQTDETFNLYHNDGKRSIWGSNGSAHDPNLTTSSTKHDVEVPWTFMAPCRTGFFVFVLYDSTAD